jgi:hypothetical protein
MSHEKVEKPGKVAHHEHAAGVTFARAGNQCVNLAHVVSVSLPVDGDPKQPLTLNLVTGTTMTLAGDDADAMLEALGACCDVTPEKAAK